MTSRQEALASCSACATRSAATKRGSAVSSARMPISVGPGLGVDADHAAQQPLGRRDVDVARPHHEVGRLAVVGAVGEHRDRLGAADRVHLVDAEQGAGREDDRVRQAVVVPLRRAGDGQRPDTGDLGGHDVHHDARRVGHQPARHVEPDPAYRHPALGDRAARGRPRRRRRARRCASCTVRARRAASSSAARTAGSSASRAAASASARHPGRRRRRRRPAGGSTRAPRRRRGAGRPRRSGGRRPARPRRPARRAAARRGSTRRARPPQVHSGDHPGSLRTARASRGPAVHPPGRHAPPVGSATVTWSAPACRGGRAERQAAAQRWHAGDRGAGRGRGRVHAAPLRARGRRTVVRR